MDIQDDQPQVAEVRAFDRRSDDKSNSYLIAGSFHADQYSIRDHLGLSNQVAQVPDGVNKVPNYDPGGTPTPFPEEVQFSFLGKDITEGMRVQWPWLDKHLRAGEKSYDWVHNLKPDLLVVWSDVYPEQRGACLAAQELGIPIIELVHGQTHPYRIGDYSTRKYADYFLGTQGYAAWHNFNQCRGSVVLTGSPPHDAYANVNLPQLRLVARHELDIPEHACVVTLLTDKAFERSAWSDDGKTTGYFVEMVKALRMLKEIVPHFHIIVKRHPADTARLRSYEVVLNQCGWKDNFTIMDSPLVTALAASDVVLGVRTSAFSDALMLEVPCVCLATEPFFDVSTFENTGIHPVRKPADLLDYLSRLLLEPGHMGELLGSTTRGAWFFAGAVDGNATRRTLRGIDNVLRGRPVTDGSQHEPV